MSSLPSLDPGPSTLFEGRATGVPRVVSSHSHLTTGTEEPMTSPQTREPDLEEGLTHDVQVFKDSDSN